MTTSEIKVDTRAYRRKHGHEPRGRFLWTFRLGDGRHYFSKRGEYAECLAAAVEAARGKGVDRLSVSSVVYGQDETEEEEQARLEAERAEEAEEEGRNWGG